MKYLIVNGKAQGKTTNSKPINTKLMNYWCMARFNLLDAMIFC